MNEFVPAGHPGIGIHLHRCGGEPCLKGTRLPASIFATLRAQGFTDEKMIEWYPTATREQIAAALAWTADPDHKRIARNALRRQRYAEARPTTDPRR